MKHVKLLMLCSLALSAQTPEQKAVDYLAREVPRWSKENGCFSCHNNGDGARALFVAAKRGYVVPVESLTDTIDWLRKPASWDTNRDRKLAQIQFSAALAESFQLDADTLRQAASALAAYQEADGSWTIDVGSIGSPTTYGTALATLMARNTLEAAGLKDPAARADAWLQRHKPQNTIDLAVKAEIRKLLAAQSKDGGWGPYSNAATEPFDTAVVLIALQKSGAPRAVIDRGRDFLIGRQLETGGWPETTRPPGGQSYAQHISTSSWVTLALILTNSDRN